ncbi:MAG: MFS transporter [Alphaproteobacteria bacterium]|nr:MFS transporter [Alphaproteobacteria bacterium]
MGGPSGFGAIRRALSHREFALYTGFSIPSLVGTWIQRVAVGWLMWELTGSGAWLGLLAFADFFPVIVFSMFAGVIADRFERVWVAIVTQAGQMVCSILLLVLAVTGSATPEWLVAITALQGTASAFHQPVRQAIVARIVPRADLAAAIGINSAAWHGSRFVGPAIAGLMIVAWGVAPAFAVNAFSYLGFLWALTRLTRMPPTPRRRTLGAIPAEIVEGWRYAVGHPGIAPAFVILTVGSVFARPVAELLPGFAADVFGRGADGLALLTSAGGLGAMIGGLWLAQRGRVDGLTALVVASLIGVAGALVAFTATAILWLALPAIALIGFGLTVSGSAIQTLVQNAVEDSVQGRVLGIYGFLWLGGPAVGSLVMGVASEWVGLRLPVFAGAIVCALAWIWAVGRTKAMARELEGD